MSAFLSVGIFMQGINDVANDDSTQATLADTSFQASDTKITKNWQAIETLDSWWSGSWQYRKKLTITEPGLMDRLNDPVNLYIDFSSEGNVARVNSIRITLFNSSTLNWNEIPSQVWNATNVGGFHIRCTVLFFVNMTKGDSEVYYIYYDPTYNTAPIYPDRITARGINDIAITNDGVMPTVRHVNGTSWANSDAIQILVNGQPQASVCLVDTMRGASDWGGCANSIYSARYGGTDVFNVGAQTWMSIGEMALQATRIPDPFDGSDQYAAQRCNVGPDNPAEAWDGQGIVNVTDDGPLFTRIKIHTTDGAFSTSYPQNHVNYWYRDTFNTSVVNDTGAYRGGAPGYGAGAQGYVKYDIYYTFYYFGSRTFCKIDMDISAKPVRGTNASYAYTRSNYQDTDVNFKNFGDWPHLGQLVRATTGTVAQDRKAWYGSKYGLYNMLVGDRRRDYPIEPWTAWYDTAGDPTAGLFAITNSIGWEVTSLAVGGIGPNSLLQQILPEGHQGDIFTLRRNQVLSYDYYLLTSPSSSNWSETRDMCRRMNQPVSLTLSSRELFTHNAMFIHVRDRNTLTARGVRVIVNNSGNTATLNSTWVDVNGNTTHLRFPDGSYNVYVEMFTPNTAQRYIVSSQLVSLDHTQPSTRIRYLTYTANMANLTIRVVNWARNNESLTGAQIRILNSSNNNLIEQSFTLSGTASFRLYSQAPGTQYIIQVWYGSLLRTANITTYSLNGNVNVNIGVAIETTSIQTISQPLSVNFGGTYTTTFYYHKSDNTAIRYNPSSIMVSSAFDSLYWSQGTDYTWSVASNLITLNLISGAAQKLNDTGVFEVYIYAINSTVENATDKIFVVVDPIATGIDAFVNGTNITSTGSSEITYSEHFKVDILFFRLSPRTNITSTATVTMTNGSGGSWVLSAAGNYYTTTIDSLNLSESNKYSFVVTATSPSYEQQVFKFSIFTRPIASELRVSTSLHPGLLPTETVVMNWSDTGSFNLTFWDTFNDKFISNISTTVVAILGTHSFNAVWLENFSCFKFDMNTANLPVLVGGTTLITFRANNPAYDVSEFIFNLYVAPIEMKATFTINGYDEASVPDIFLTQTATIVVNVTRWNGIPAGGATVTLTFDNDVYPAHADYVVGPNSTAVNLYTFSIILDMNRFYGKKQFFYLRVTRLNYTNIVDDIIFDVNPIVVDAVFTSAGVTAGSNTITPDINTDYNITIMLNNTLLGVPFTSNIANIRIFISGGMLTSDQELYNLGNGVFTTKFRADRVVNFTFTLRIDVPVDMELQYQFDRTFNIIVEVQRPTGGIPEWVFWLVFGGLIGISAWFVLYQVRFKYPPLIRKIHDLKRSVARGRLATRIPAQKVKSREENIYHLYAQSVNAYGFLQTRDTRYAAKALGYAPIPDENITLEFEIPAIDKAEVEMPVQPSVKGLKKAAPAQYTEPLNLAVPVPGASMALPTAPPMPKPIGRPAPTPFETKPAAPSKPILPGVSLVSRPAIPSMPSTPAVPGMPKPPAPPSIKALPKPAVPAPKASALAASDQVKPENLYQELVLLEQKRYKAERSLRDLEAKHSRGAITDAEYNEYGAKINASLEKLKENIAQLRRKMLNF